MTSLRSWSVPLIFVYLFSTLLIAGCGKPTLDTIKVEPVAATLTVGQSLHLRATGLDAKGQPIEGLTFTWSVLEDSGRIDATGLFTAFKPGTATVTVALGTVQSTATLTVEREKAAQLVAAVEPPEVTTGQQVHLTVTVQNAAGRALPLCRCRPSPPAQIPLLTLRALPPMPMARRPSPSPSHGRRWSIRCNSAPTGNKPWWRCRGSQAHRQPCG